MWFWLALGSAVLGAVEIILSKKILGRVSPALLSWSFFVLTLPIVIAIAFFQGIPQINSLFLIGVIGSSLFFVVARTLFNQALQNNLVSQLLPLTAFSGVFTYIFGLFMLSESLRILPLIGLFSVIIGSYILNADQAKEDLLKPFKLLMEAKGSLFFLIALLLGSITAIFDKMGVKNTFPENPTFVILSEQVMQSVLMSAYLFKAESKTWLPSLKQNFLMLFLMSVIFLAVSFFVFYAYIQGSVALVIGIKRMQIFFILIMGYFFLKDRPTRHSWIATIIMILGVVLIRLG